MSKKNYVIKNFELFNQNQNKNYSKKKKSYHVNKHEDLPIMNSLNDFSTWLVKQIPEEEKLKFIEDIKKL